MADSFRRSPSSRAVFRGWWVVGSLFLVLMSSSGLGFYSLPILVRVMSAEGLFSVHTVSTASALFFVASGLAGMAVARLLERYDVRWVVTGGSLICAACLAGLGHVTAEAELFGLYAVFGVGFAATSLVPAMTVVTRWFHRRRAIAVSVASTGLSVGGVVVAPQIAGFVEAYGLGPVAPWLGLAYLIGTVPLTWLFVHDAPERLGLWPDGEAGPEGTEAAPEPVGVAYRDAVRSAFFIWFALTYIFVMAAQVGGMIHLYNLTAQRVDPGFARLVMGTVALASISGRFGGGFVLHHLPIQPVAAVLILVQGLSLLGLATTQDASWILFFVVGFGLSVGNLLMIQPIMLVEAFGVKDYGRIYAFSQLLTTVGYAAGPEVMGALFDRSGGYRTPFLVMGFACLTGFLLFGAALRASKREGGKTEPSS